MPRDQSLQGEGRMDPETIDYYLYLVHTVNYLKERTDDLNVTNRLQLSFKKDPSTVQAIWLLGKVVQTAGEEKDLYLVFNDYVKAFDSVNSEALVSTLIAERIF